MTERDLPQEIYYVQGAGKARPYTNSAHVKSAIKTRWRGSGKWLRIYVAVIGGETGWQDVTQEFLNSEGKPTW